MQQNREALCADKHPAGVSVGIKDQELRTLHPPAFRGQRSYFRTVLLSATFFGPSSLQHSKRRNKNKRNSCRGMLHYMIVLLLALQTTAD